MSALEERLGPWHRMLYRNASVGAARMVGFFGLLWLLFGAFDLWTLVRGYERGLEIGWARFVMVGAGYGGGAVGMLVGWQWHGLVARIKQEIESAESPMPSQR